MEASPFSVEFTRIYLAVFFSGVATFYTWRIITQKKVQAREVVFPGRCMSNTWWNHMTFRVFRATIWMICVFRVGLPELDQYLGILPWVLVDPVVWFGDICLTLGFGLAIYVHFTLGRQWRSGIDPDAPVTLLTQGLYRFSRNPMFVGVALAQLGFFLALPSVFSLVCLIIGWVALRRQTLAEEAHLSNLFPQSYADYRKQVPRWVKINSLSKMNA